MKKSTALNLATFLLVILGIAILYIGISSAQIIWPPVITGLGFFVISWVFYRLND